MYKLFTITILTSFSIIRLCAQDDFESEMRNHPYFINNQNKIKDSFYQHTCKGAPYIVLSDIDNLVIPGLFLSKLSSIINTDNCYIEMDSIYASNASLVWEFKQNEEFNIYDLCKDEKLLDDIYIWFDVEFVNYVEATIYIDYSINIDLIRSWIEQLSGTELWSPEIRFLSQLPAIVDPSEVVSIVLMSLSLSLLATLYPAWRAARLDPVDALRYE